LKSTSWVVGARTLATLCDKLQTLDDDASPGDAEAWVDEVEDELARVAAALGSVEPPSG
jgi:hypothetical protein